MAATPAPTASAVKPTSGTIISAGDTLSITVFPVEEYSKEVTVAPDGRIEMALIGSVLVKGLSNDEIQDILQKKYARYIANPKIAVNVKHFSGRRVAVIGDVRSPGYFEYRDGMKMLEVIALSNGFNDTASISKIWVLRQDANGRNKSVRINYKKVLRGDPNRDPFLEPGDTVYVPKQSLAMTSSWLNTNVLPWAFLVSTILTAVLAEQALKKQ